MSRNNESRALNTFPSENKSKALGLTNQPNNFEVETNVACEELGYIESIPFVERELAKKDEEKM